MFNQQSIGFNQTIGQTKCWWTYEPAKTMILQGSKIASCLSEWEPGIGASQKEWKACEVLLILTFDPFVERSAVFSLCSSRCFSVLVQLSCDIVAYIYCRFYLHVLTIPFQAIFNTQLVNFEITKHLGNPGDDGWPLNNAVIPSCG